MTIIMTIAMTIAMIVMILTEGGLIQNDNELLQNDDDRARMSQTLPWPSQ